MENIDKIKCILLDYGAFDKTLNEAANEILLLFSVVGRSEQLVCDYCGKDKVDGLDHCECYNGTAWVKKAN